MASEQLSSAHRYAAGGLFALALRQAQLHQHSEMGFGFPLVMESPNDGASSAFESNGEIPWSHEESGLVRNVFRCLGIDQKAWVGLESTALSMESKHHISAFLKLMGEDDEESRKLTKDAAELAKAVDIMDESTKEKQVSTPDSKGKSQEPKIEMERFANGENSLSLNEAKAMSYERKVAVIYTLLAACVADTHVVTGYTTAEASTENNVAKSGYDARQRVALRLLVLWLDIDWAKVGVMELMVAYMAMAAQRERDGKRKDEEEEESQWAQWKRAGFIGAAAVTGGTLLAITGGLAAPAIAAGMAAIGSAVPILGAGGLTAAAAVAGSAVGSAAVTASFGVAGARLTGMKMARRMRDIDEFAFETLGSNHQQGRLAVEIVVSGIAFSPDDFVKPWEAPDGDSERYALLWETEHVIAVSSAIQDWLTSTAMKEVIKRGAMRTILGGLLSALSTPLAFLGATDLIDSKWQLAIDRSGKAGKLLATVLLQGGQGSRPVTLIGYALGARVIFTCLEELAKHGNEGIGIVERVVLLGTPETVEKSRWESARKVVAGRFVNGFSTNDWVLGVCYRANLMSQGLAGLQAVKVPGIENVDLSDMIDGHASYLTSLKHILNGINLDNFYSTQPYKLHMSTKDKEEARSTTAGPAPDL